MNISEDILVTFRVPSVNWVTGRQSQGTALEEPLNLSEPGGSSDTEKKKKNWVKYFQGHLHDRLPVLLGKCARENQYPIWKKGPFLPISLLNLRGQSEYDSRCGYTYDQLCPS